MPTDPRSLALLTLALLATVPAPEAGPGPRPSVADATLDPGHYAARVRRGAELLDLVVPGWHLRVDPATLAMGDPARDILAQALGPHRAGVPASPDDAAGLGFGLSAREWEVDDPTGRPWPIDCRMLALTVAWRMEIAWRTGGQAP